MKLNVGCGFDKWGDIRVDIQPFSNIFYNRKTSANIIADVQHLPFKPKIFNETRCYHVLEHVPNPVEALKELQRVTNGKIIIRVPIWHLYSYIGETITLFKAFLLILKCGTFYFLDTLRKIKKWKKRYGDHKWYIKFRNAKINKVYHIIPQEYEIQVLG